MKLTQFIKLIYKHLFILIIVPIILGAIVFYLTKDEIKMYKSSTTVYTGIASGYNIETSGGAKFDFLAAKNSFDNLINIIDSRETYEEVGIKLLTKHLSLSYADPKYITKKHFNELQQIVPNEVKELLYKEASIKKLNNRKKTVTPKKPKKNITIENQNISKFHFVKAKETLYSIARKYNIPVKELMRINGLTNNNIKVDDRLLIITSRNQPSTKYYQKEKRPTSTDTFLYYITDKNETLYSIASKYNISVAHLIAWNNLTKREISKGKKLIVGSINYPVEPKVIKNNNSKKLVEKTKIKKSNTSNSNKINEFDRIYSDFVQYKNKSDTNFLYELLNYSHPHYSIKALSRMKIKRIGNSDLVEISYETDDPGICQYSLVLLTEVFIKNYKHLKENQTDAVVKYFQRQVNMANNRLQLAEDKLLNFNQKNNIINYYEQTKFIAEQKEELDLTFQNENMRRASADAALKKVEGRLNIRNNINLTSSEILDKRHRLADISMKISMTEAYAEDSTAWELVYLKNKQAEIKKELENYISELYGYNNSVQGMPIKQLLEKWLENVVKFEESNARLAVLRERKEEFNEKYRLMAPLGAILKRIEREINVAEKEYLSLLHSLNLSKLRQQNIEMSSNIKAVDPAYYPIIPKASKRKVMILAAAFAGFMMVLALIVILEYFDSTIKTPERAEKLIGLKFGGVFPRIPNKHGKINYTFITQRMSEKVIQKIKLKSATAKNKAGEPKIISFFSTRENEGKTFLANTIGERVTAFNENILLVTPFAEDEEIPEDVENTFFYQYSKNEGEINSIDELLTEDYKANKNKYKYIFVEIPSIIKQNYSSNFIKSFDFSLLIARANRTWTKADKHALSTYKKLCKNEPLFILNGTEPDALVSTIGEIPKERSFLRKLFKKIISLQIYNKSKI
ncbi:MAG: LysM peptidoglycan-binding domain-containing protein [Bacteroidota bacterium]|nr:LysM peptidoglycan-binding domain-containing protein [Bacteroidota bacterium]